MRSIAAKTIVLACLATAYAHVPRTFGPLIHNHGPDCDHPPLFNALRPSYYTIPGYDLIIPAEEIDGPQNNVIYDGPRPLEPIVFQPEEEVPLQKFVHLPAPAVFDNGRSLEVLGNTVSELASHLYKPGIVQPPPPVVVPCPEPVPVPPPAPVLVPDCPPPVVIAPPPAPVAIPPPPVLPEAPILPSILPLPLAPEPPCPIVRWQEIIEPAVVLPPAPPVFVDVTPKPFFVNPPPPAPLHHPFGPVEVHRNRGGYSYKLINNLAFHGLEHKKADQHSVKHVVKIPEPPFVTPAPIPRPVVPFFELPPPPALPGAPLPPVATKTDNIVEIKTNPISVKPALISRPVAPFFELPPPPALPAAPLPPLATKTDNIVEIKKKPIPVTPAPIPRPVVPLFELPPPPVLPSAPLPPVEIKTEDTVKIKENPIPVLDSRFSYHQHNVDGSLTTFDGTNAQQKTEFRNPGPLFSLPTAPVFLPARSDVQVNIKESSAPAAGSGYSYNLHNADGSVISFGGSRKEADGQAMTFGLPALPRPQNAVKVPAPAPAIVTPLSSVPVPAPPALPGLIKVPLRYGENQAINGGYSYKLINNALEKVEAKAQIDGSAAKDRPEQPRLEVNAGSGGFVYKSFQKDGSVTTYKGASPATENISGPSPLKIMVNRINELCNTRGIRFNGGYNYAEKASAVTVSPLHIPAPPALPSSVIPVLPSGNIEASPAKGGYSYKLVNNGAFVNNDFHLPRLTPTPGPVVHITSRPVTVTQGSAATSGFKFSYSTPSISSSSFDVKTNFVSTTAAPVPAFSEPIVVPEQGGYSYRKTNLDGSTLKVDSDQSNQVTVSVDESRRGDIPMMGID